MTRSRVLAAALLAAAIASPSTARADESAEAKALFARGRELVAQGRCADAIPKFRRAMELYPAALGSLRNIATCEESMKKLASARRDWWELKTLAAQSRDRKYASWASDAEDAFKKLSPRVPRLKISLRGKGFDTATVTVNGEPLDRALVDDDVERDAGHYDIVVEGGSEGTIKRSVNLEEGDAKTVTIRVSKEDVPVGAPTQPDKPDATASATPTSTSQPSTTPGWTLFGFGVGLGVVAAVNWVIYASVHSTIAACSPNCDKTQEGGAFTRGQIAAVVAPITTGLGALGIGLGAALVLHAGSASRVHGFLVPLQSGAFVGAEARF